MKKVNVEMSFPEIYKISQLVEKQIKQANRAKNYILHPKEDKTS